jgi:hypothetical protein
MKNRFIFILFSIPGIFAAILFPSAELRAAEIAKPSDRPPLYARVCEPQVKPAFLPLPIGAVEPQGWLRDWAKCALALCFSETKNRQ